MAASQHGEPLFPAQALATLRDTVIPAAELVTPNLHEVRLLTGLEVTTAEQMREAARMLHDLGPTWVLVKVGNCPTVTPWMCSTTAATS